MSLDDIEREKNEIEKKQLMGYNFLLPALCGLRYEPVANTFVDVFRDPVSHFRVLRIKDKFSSVQILRAVYISFKPNSR